MAKISKTKHKADHDWTRDGRRVECKSACLRPGALLGLHFYNVKCSSDKGLGAFDELWLVMHSEFGLHIFEHDLKSGLASTGKATATKGHQIKFYIPRAVQSSPWQVQLRSLMDKIVASSGCKLLAVVPWTDASD